MNLLDPANSGLLAGILAFVASIVATVLLFASSRRQANLLKTLQDEKLEFDSKSSKELEKYRDELSKEKLKFEADLKRQEDFKSQQMANLFAAVERSQAITRVTMTCFQTLVDHSLFLKNDEMLGEFNEAIIEFKKFSDSVASLSNLVRKKDAAYFENCRDGLLRILLGMRFELDRRQEQEFGVRVTEYQQKLRLMNRILNVKYRRFLQPRAAVWSLKKLTA